MATSSIRKHARTEEDEPFHDRRTRPRPRPTYDRPLTHGDYNVGWICALSVERAAAEAMLDEIHPHLSTSNLDRNSYTLGNIGIHNIVIACLPSGHYGSNNATAVAIDMSRTFPSIDIRLMVGIGGGVSTLEADIRLGDVVVGEQVIQYDMGKALPNSEFICTGLPTRPPQILATAITKIRARHSRTPSEVGDILSKIFQRFPEMTSYAHPNLEDKLFRSSYNHPESMSNCHNCDGSSLQVRPVRMLKGPKIHYGKIASGNQVIKDGSTRDKRALEFGAICFEMEAAGLIDNFPCLVVRGISDYCDSHKNKEWQPYASAVAAAYTKELLSIIPTNSSSEIHRNQELELPVDRTESLLHWLDFEERDSRHDTIKGAHTKTCEWFLKHPYYVDWKESSKFDQHHGFLWINGKPGAGKSTLMKFCFTEAQKEWKSTSGTAVISFFFNARGGDLEKTTKGMYRSLLYQILQKFPELHQAFDEIDPQHKAWQDPSTETLQDTFGRIAQDLGNRRLFCYIDALDECDEDQIRTMVEYFEQIGELASQTSRMLYICFSSRHYPYINIQHSHKLTLEDQPGHADDLEKYVRGKLKAGKGKAADDVISKILDKSSGVFMWAVLVITILNKEYSRGRIFAVKRRLQELPAELSKLFKDILTRDSHNMDDLLLCIQWILYSERPLCCEEFYFALVSDLDPSESLNEWDRDSLTFEDMHRFVLSSSKGLAELSKSKNNKTVQFIHESVRDYLIKEDGIRDLWPDRWQDFTALSHERLKKCCHQYLEVDFSDLVPLGISFHDILKKDRKLWQTRVLKRFPFLEYATSYIFHHAEAASLVVSEQDFLQNFDIMSWLRLGNLFAKYDNRRHNPSTPIMCILAENNLTELLRIALQLDLEVGESLIFAASKGHNSVVSLLLELTSVDINARKISGQKALLAAAEKGHDHVVHCLLQRQDIDPNIKNTFYRTPLSLAALGGHQRVVELLLASADIDINAEDSNYQSALTLASMKGKSRIVELLLSTGSANINSYDFGRQTPLSHAAANGHKAIVELLISTGSVDINCYNSTGQTPLSCATLNGHKEIVELLISIGSVNINCYNSDRRSPLSYAAEKGHVAIVELLLSTDSVDINCCDSFGRSPFSYAAEKGHVAIVELLLSTDSVDINCCDSFGRSPLSYAAANGRKAIVELLISTGSVDINCCDSDGQTPFSHAVKNGCREIAELLLSCAVH